MSAECGNVAIHDINDIYVFCCREILKKHNTNIQHYHLKWLFWRTCLQTISYLHIKQKNINIKFKKERSKALFRLENLRPDGFLYGVVLKNTDKCVFQKQELICDTAFFRVMLPKSTVTTCCLNFQALQTFFLIKKKNPLESCLMNVSPMFTLFAPFVVFTNSAAAKGVHRWFTRADSSVLKQDSKWIHTMNNPLYICHLTHC